MNGRELNEKLHYFGMERGIRRLALQSFPDEKDEIAEMSNVEVCDRILGQYEVVSAENERICLVKKRDYEVYQSIVEIVSR